MVPRTLASPTGSNPTGATAPLERRKAILALVQKYNLLLLEDDAYHYLSFDSDHLIPSYFELEGQEGAQKGRVVRFDSFSKILSSGKAGFYALSPSVKRLSAHIDVEPLAGMRLGFVTCAPELLNVIDLHTSNTNLQPS